MSIYVAIPCRNRKRIAALCLPTMRDSALAKEDLLTLFNDGSVEYTDAWLSQFLPPGHGAIFNDPVGIGIQGQRRLHLALFMLSSCTHLYFSDHDAIVDPDWRNQGLRLQEKYGGAPLCLYSTPAHVRLIGNTIEDNPESEVIWRRVAPGISYLLTRDHVDRISRHLDQIHHFDWEIPAILGSRFAVSRTSYVDHIGWGGERHPPEESYDGGDRALNPTPFLVEKRREIVAALQAQDRM